MVEKNRFPVKEKVFLTFFQGTPNKHPLSLLSGVVIKADKDIYSKKHNTQVL